MRETAQARENFVLSSRWHARLAREVGGQCKCQETWECIELSLHLAGALNPVGRPGTVCASRSLHPHGDVQGSTGRQLSKEFHGKACRHVGRVGERSRLAASSSVNAATSEGSRMLRIKLAGMFTASATVERRAHRRARGCPQCRW
ncbi:hypothetical protein DDE05_12390, partial [Streptomyces cavourensis]